MHQQLRSGKWRERTINIKKEVQKEWMNFNRKKDAEGKTEKSKRNRKESKDTDIKYFSFLFAALYSAFTKGFKTYDLF